MTEIHKTTYDIFKSNQKKKLDTNILEAKKLVNIYRHLDHYGKDYLPEYNKLLLASSSDVQAALPSILGGSEVLEYLHFLRHSKVVEDDTRPQEYLPNPEDMDCFMDYGLQKILQTQNMILKKQMEILEMLAKDKKGE